MNDLDHDPSREEGPDDSLEPGLRAAFPRQPAEPAGSILDVLSHLSGQRPRVALREESSDPGGRPLRPLTGGDRPVVVLTDDGRAVMKGERPARLLLPARSVARRGPRRAERSPAASRPGGIGRAASEPDAAAEHLFEALRRHRLEVARAEGVAPFIVASDRTLRDIAGLRPRTIEELLLAHGIGRQKAERYGRGLLEVVRTSRAEREGPA